MLIPDGITPVRGFRSWRFDNGILRSQHDGSAWRPGEPYEAHCQHAYWEWVAVEGGGETLEDIQKTRLEHYVPVSNQAGGNPLGGYAFTPGQVQSITAYAPVTPQVQRYGPPDLPNVKLPEGWGYTAKIVSHAVPDERCGCGVYAAAIEGVNPPNDIRGEVNLWGKVIQGARAHRATFAYPAKLYCHEAQREALEAYGVPIVVYPKPKPKPKLRSSADVYYQELKRQQQLLYGSPADRQYEEMIRRLNEVRNRYQSPRYTPPPKTTNTTNTTDNTTVGPDLLGTWWESVQP